MRRFSGFILRLIYAEAKRLILQMQAPSSKFLNFDVRRAAHADVVGLDEGAARGLGAAVSALGCGRIFSPKNDMRFGYLAPALREGQDGKHYRKSLCPSCG